MLEDRLGKRFTYKEMIILDGTLALEQVREAHLKQMYTLLEVIKEQGNSLGLVKNNH